MAERPIKKGDRDAAKQAEGAQVEKTTSDAPKRDTPKPVKKGDRKEGDTGSEVQATYSRDGDSRDGGRGGKGGGGGGKGRGKGRGRDDEAPRGPLNPALVRGAKTGS